jgi:hypothetical protein
MYYADLALSDLVFLLIVRTILGIIGANLYQKNYVFLRSIMPVSATGRAEHHGVRPGIRPADQ